MTEEEFAELMADPNLFKTPSYAEMFNDIFSVKPSANLIDSAMRMHNEETARVAFSSGSGACQERAFVVDHERSKPR